MLTRRRLLIAGGGLLVGGLAACTKGSSSASTPTDDEPASSAPIDGDWRNLTDEQWHQRLSSEQYDVLRQSGTETPFTSKLLDEHRSGVFACAGCDLDLFSSSTKFDSGTGWPSFWEPLPNAVVTTADQSLDMDRTAVQCSRCDGHLGHVFEDGPPPTGLRYCMNGIALTFEPGTAPGSTGSS